MTSDPERVYNVALFGVTGCGKSSIVNLLSDWPVASVSAGVEPCTKRARWYSVQIEQKRFRLWDTIGFNQAETSKDVRVNPLSPYEQAHALLQNLPSGIDLILLCAQKDGINARLRNLYWLLDSLFFGGRAQIALVLTHFDTLDEEQWWSNNKHVIQQRCDIPVNSLPHACITTVRDKSSESVILYDKSKKKLMDLLKDHAATPTTRAPTQLRPDLLSSEEAAESLQKYCQLNAPDAQLLVQKFRSPKRCFNVILFGDAGAGKSSVINLVVGEQRAPVSRNIQSCTLDFCGYEINTGLRQFLIWDTVGFNGLCDGQDVTVLALEKAAQLIRGLHSKGGVDLLVLCKKGGRLTPTEINSLRLFQEFLCEGQIPVAFIITHLEDLDPMEEWWKTNGEGVLKACKVSAVGHACITSAPDAGKGNERLREQLSQSRQSVQAMFEDSVSHGDTFYKEEGLWVVSFLKRLAVIVRAGNASKKITAKNLVTRCGLTKQQADEVIKIYRTPTKTGQ